MSAKFRFRSGFATATLFACLLTPSASQAACCEEVPHKCTTNCTGGEDPYLAYGQCQSLGGSRSSCSNPGIAIGVNVPALPNGATAIAASGLMLPIAVFTRRLQSKG